MTPTTQDSREPDAEPERPHPEADLETTRQTSEGLRATLAEVTTVDLSDLSHDELLEFARFVDMVDELPEKRMKVDDLASTMQVVDKAASNSALSGQASTPLTKAMGELLHERAVPAEVRITVLHRFFQGPAGDDS